MRYYLILLLVVIIFSSEITLANNTIGTNNLFRQNNSKTINIELAAEIVKMYQEDQAIQFDFQFNPPDEKHNDRKDELFARNIKRLKEIVKQYGWPGKSLLGEKVSHKFFILVDHADADITFQKECLVLLEKAGGQGEAAKADMAILTDRILIAEKKKQIYGTQMMDREESKSQDPTPYPIEDEANVDKRRNTVGLEPLAKYIEGIKAMERAMQEQLKK